MKKIVFKHTPIENYSNFYPKSRKPIEVIKKHNYYIDTSVNISGDAPKCFLRLYEYRRKYSKKSKPKKWDSYIAKTGHKWYPMESITEFLLGVIGKELGVKMADQKLAQIGGQIRFLSKYFLKKDEILVHGMEIYSKYFGDEKEVLEIESENRSRDELTLQLTQDAISNFFPENSNTILIELVKLLLFDAFVGNNDRHFYNWGIVKNIKDKKEPYFSPIYDTARGLFWNFSEEKIDTYLKDKELETKLLKYVENSRPKIGWKDETNINHINIVKLIYDHEFYSSKKEIKEFFSLSNYNKCCAIIDNQFKYLLSNYRKDLIKKYFKLRISKINKVLTK